MRLARLVERLGGECRPAGADPVVADVQLDSRRVGPGDLFAALQGSKDHGARFVPDALARGAVAVLTPHELDLRTGTPTPSAAPQWLHPDARRVAGRAAALVHGAPASAMALFGVTGTNGKTTTAHLLAQLLERAGRRPAVLGTAGHRLAGGVELAASHTTPDAPELQRLLRRHREAGGDAAVLEVSSHALVQERTEGLDFEVALFTNLSREHLDYHADLAAYAAAKARLFAGLAPGRAALVHAGDAHAGVMAAAARSAGARVYTYGAGTDADLRADRLRTDPQGTHFLIDGMGIASTGLRIGLRGRYNVENALAAAAAALLAGASPSTVVEGLATVRPAPGRLEPVPAERRGLRAYVDYAHSPDALERVLEALREEAGAARLILVFGCGGERDRGKRPQMGRIAARLADLAILTSDNPRGEDPEAIAREVLAGTEGGSALVVELDRRAAIERAVALARPGDVLLVAGKGHEGGQTAGGRTLPFDDRLVLAEVLA